MLEGCKFLQEMKNEKDDEEMWGIGEGSGES